MPELRFSASNDIGILPALSWYSRQTGKNYPGVSLEYAAAVEESDIPENLKPIVFRVVDESVVNALRHGKSSLIKIALEKEKAWLRVTIEDNGGGFGAIKKSDNSGIGLGRMQHCVDATGGIFSIRSTPGKGTRVKAEWRTG